MLLEKPKIREFIRRPTKPHFCVPPGDAAFAACQARVRDALELTQLRDNCFCELVDLGLNQWKPITC
jgi:hypothetical protein